MHLVRHQPFLVIAGSQSDRIGKADARHRLGQRGVRCGWRGSGHQAEQHDRKMMRAFCIEREEKRADKAVGHGAPMPLPQAAVESL